MSFIDQFDIGSYTNTNPIDSAKVMQVDVDLEFTSESFISFWGECGKLSFLNALKCSLSARRSSFEADSSGRSCIDWSSPHHDGTLR